MNLKNLILGNIEQDELLNFYNVTVEYVNIPYSDVKGLVDYYKGIYFIYINKNISKAQQRKTLLHELAHIELNHLCQIDGDLFAFHIDKYEDEADKYIKTLINEKNLTCCNK